MKMPVAEAVRVLLAAAITVKVFENVDNVAAGNAEYRIFRPLLVSSLMYSAYRSLYVESVQK